MRTPWWLWCLALLGGALFFLRAPQLWPLVRVDLQLSDAEVTRRARGIAQNLGVRGGTLSTVTLSLDETQIDFLDKTFGREQAQRRIAEGAPVARYSAVLSTPGDPHRISLDLHPSGKLLVFVRTIEDDDPMPPDRAVSEPEARKTLGALTETSLTGWRLISSARRDQPNRVERTYVYEQLLEKGLRERMAIGYAGGQVVRVVRNFVTPPEYLRRARPDSQAQETLELIGMGMFAPLTLIGAGVFLLRLRGGTARLRAPAILAGGAFTLLMLSHLPRFVATDPLTPDALELARFLVSLMGQYGWTFALLFAVISAGDALDREVRGGTGGRTLDAFARLRWRTPGVAAASRNGFLIGVLCGGVMTALIWLLGWRCALQPRAFHLAILNSTSPPLVTLTYFLQIALLEELGYRYFAATWIELKTKRRWLAILVPALIYGLTHASLGFLPPAEPLWARALLMCVVGGIWGVAFFRFDALTVVLSHLAADLFIFNWPGIQRGDIGSILVAAAPLLPLVVSLPLPRSSGTPFPHADEVGKT